jgi:hypothetical protein
MHESKMHTILLKSIQLQCAPHSCAKRGDLVRKPHNEVRNRCRQRMQRAGVTTLVIKRTPSKGKQRACIDIIILVYEMINKAGNLRRESNLRRPSQTTDPFLLTN